jgi:hypothetical protein
MDKERRSRPNFDEMRRRPDLMDRENRRKPDFMERENRRRPEFDD